MNPDEHELHYPWTEPPATGAWITLRPGLHWVRMPLPFALDHINLWVLDDEIEGRSGFTIVDSGIASAETKAAWERMFDGLFDGRPLLRQICTHFHPDHLGLAHWLTSGGERARWSAPLWMTADRVRVRPLPFDRRRRHQRRRCRRALPAPRPGRRSLARQGAGARRGLLPEAGARRAAALPPHPGRRRDRDRTGACAARVPRHRRLRTRARARLALLRGRPPADRRRHGAAADLDQCQRVRRRARRQPAAALPSLARPVAAAAGRHPGAAVARQALHRPARAHRAAAPASSRAPGRSAGGLRDAADCRDHRAGALQARTRPAPDDVCARREPRAPACAVVRRGARTCARSTACSNSRPPEIPESTA